MFSTIMENGIGNCFVENIEVITHNGKLLCEWGNIEILNTINWLGY